MASVSSVYITNMREIKIVTIVGARPQFIKAAAISGAIKAYNGKGGIISFREIIVHTGQHYDENMSKVFFDQMGIPKPTYQFDLRGVTHGNMTAGMLSDIEGVLISERPDWVLVYGDTNSTLAGALAAAKLHIPVAHVEAGLRSYNKKMPEEINRILTDHVSKILLCPTDVAVKNLFNEGIYDGVHNVGDVMYDVSLAFRDIALVQSDVLVRHDLQRTEYALATVHRAENTDDPGRLSGIFSALNLISKTTKVVFPLHPRTKKYIKELNLLQGISGNIILTDPLPFLDMVRLEQSAKIILTDSGGVQKEAFFYNVPCITLRDETEWVETVDLGWNVLAGANFERIMSAFIKLKKPSEVIEVYGDGAASKKILDILKSV